MQYPPYTIVIDAGIPYEETAPTLEQVREVLAHVHQIHIVDAEEDVPHLEVNVYDDIDRDITDSEVIRQMFAEIAGEKSPAPSWEDDARYDEETLLDMMEEEVAEEDLTDEQWAELDKLQRTAWEESQAMGREAATCTYGDAAATTRCSICGVPMCPSCGFTLGESKLCNKCWELDPR